MNAKLTLPTQQWRHLLSGRLMHFLNQALLTLAFVLGVFGFTQPAFAEAPAPERATAKYEIRFLTNMIDHHQGAVVTGMICEEQAVHEELRELCHDIVEAQQAEITLMQQWLMNWYGISYEPELTPGDRRQAEKLASLEGAEFEIAFMEMMIKHHKKAIIRGEHCIERAFHEDLVDLCMSIVEVQRQEIGTMQTWLCDWYDECN